MHRETAEKLQHSRPAVSPSSAGLALLLTACASTGDGVPHAKAQRCPPAATASVAGPQPSAEPPSAEPRWAELPGLAQHWTESFAAGDVQLLTVDNDAVLVPRFMGATIEGTRMARLEPSGRPRWERSFPAVGSWSAALTSSGGVVAIAVDRLNWPKTAEPYGRQRLLTIDAQGLAKWSAPAGIELDDVAVFEDGAMAVSGHFDATVKLSPAIELEAKGARGHFVAKLDKSGKVTWATEVEGARSLSITSSEQLVAARGSRGVAISGLQLLDESGSSRWVLEPTATCGIEDLAVTRQGQIYITLPKDCRTLDAAREDGTVPGRDCRVFSLDLASGRAQASAEVPGCVVRASANRMLIADLNLMEPMFRITAFDASLRPLRSQLIAHPREQGGSWNDMQLADDSLYLLGSAPGARIGTMFNSHYARAYDASTTFLARYERP